MKKFSAFLFLLLAGCATTASGPAAVTLNAAKTGERVTLTLRNDATAPAGYNLCSSTLQRNEGGTWANVPTDEMCTRELRSLEPGDTATFQKTLPAGASAGEYRYATTVHVSEQGREVSSNSFRVP